MTEVAPPETVLIVLHGAIGDVVRALPLAVRIKKYWPSTKIIWAIEPKSKDLLVDHPAIDDLVVFHRDGGLSEFRKFLREIAVRKPDITLDLQRHFKSGVVSYFSGAKLRLGFHRKDSKEFNFLFNNKKISQFSDELPKILHYQKFGDLLGLPPLEPLDFGLTFSQEIRESADHMLAKECRAIDSPLPEKERRVALLIGGSWESKRWTASGFSEVAERCVEELHSLPILLGGPGDEELSDAILRSVPDLECVSLVGKTNLRQLAYLLTQVKYAVSTDSGPMHIASAVGTPVVSLWGPTSPKRTGPYGSHDYLIQSAIGCSPCKRRKCPGLKTLCMSDIPAEAVMQRLKEIRDSSS